jgi:hypothetical protein
MYSAVSGNVGIGTSNPQTKLEIYGSGDVLRFNTGTTDGIAKISLYDDNSVQTNHYFSFLTDDVMGTGAGGIQLNTDQNIGLNIEGQGGIFIHENDAYVGIGTTTPSQRLHVSGNMRLTGALYDVNNQAGTSGQVLTTTGSGVDWVDVSTLDDGDWTVSGNNMYSAVSGNVGIGTSNPQTLLDMLSSNNEPTLRILGPVDSGGIIELGDTDVSDLLVISGANGGSTHDIGIFAKDELTIGTTGLNHSIYFFTGGSSNVMRMTIAGATGYVGIGTTTPSLRLLVSGNMRLSGAM